MNGIAAGYLARRKTRLVLESILPNKAIAQAERALTAIKIIVVYELQLIKA